MATVASYSCQHDVHSFSIKFGNQQSRYMYHIHRKTHSSSISVSFTVSSKQHLQRNHIHELAHQRHKNTKNSNNTHKLLYHVPFHLSPSRLAKQPYIVCSADETLHPKTTNTKPPSFNMHEPVSGNARYIYVLHKHICVNNSQPYTEKGDYHIHNLTKAVIAANRRCV